MYATMLRLNSSLVSCVISRYPSSNGVTLYSLATPDMTACVSVSVGDQPEPVQYSQAREVPTTHPSDVHRLDQALVVDAVHVGVALATLCWFDPARPLHTGRRRQIREALELQGAAVEGGEVVGLPAEVERPAAAVRNSKSDQLTMSTVTVAACRPVHYQPAGFVRRRA